MWSTTASSAVTLGGDPKSWCEDGLLPVDELSGIHVASYETPAARASGKGKVVTVTNLHAVGESTICVTNRILRWGRHYRLSK